jgi:hypothetical protein
MQVPKHFSHLTQSNTWFVLGCSITAAALATALKACGSGGYANKGSLSNTFSAYRSSAKGV